jgi:hypothetical protein
MVLQYRGESSFSLYIIRVCLLVLISASKFTFFKISPPFFAHSNSSNYFAFSLFHLLCIEEEEEEDEDDDSSSSSSSSSDSESDEFDSDEELVSIKFLSTSSSSSPKQQPRSTKQNITKAELSWRNTSFKSFKSKLEKHVNGGKSESSWIKAIQKRAKKQRPKKKQANKISTFFNAESYYKPDFAHYTDKEGDTIVIRDGKMLRIALKDAYKTQQKNGGETASDFKLYVTEKLHKQVNNSSNNFGNSTSDGSGNSINNNYSNRSSPGGNGNDFGSSDEFFVVNGEEGNGNRGNNGQHSRAMTAGGLYRDSSSASVGGGGQRNYGR